MVVFGMSRRREQILVTKKAMRITLKLSRERRYCRQIQQSKQVLEIDFTH
jgi:hypothetical protein